MNRFRSSLLVACFVSGAVLSACTEPKELEHVDPHLKRAFELASEDPEAALSELSLATGASPAQRAYVEGLALEGQKKFGAAAVALKKALELDPKGIMPKTALARVQILQGQIRDAQKNLASVIMADPGSLPAILLLVVTADSDQLRKQARLALEAWPETRAKSETQAPLRAEYFLALAQVTGDAAKRQQALDRSQSAKVGSIDATISFAQFAALTEKHALASRLIARLVGADASPEQLQTIASLALSIGAVASAEQALNRIPGNVRTTDILTLRGRHELLVHHPKRALSHFVGALQVADKNDKKVVDELEYYVASAFHADSDDSEALDVLTRLLKRSPNHRAAQFLVSDIELGRGQTASALTQLESLEQRFPLDPDILLRLGDALMRADKHAEAEARFRKAFFLRPSDMRLPARIIHVLQKRADETAALTFIRETRSGRPESLPLLRAEATELIRMKKPEEAILAVQTAGATMGDQVSVKLLLADIYDALGQEAEVAKVLTALVQTESESARAWSALARLQGRQKDFVKMEESLRAVVRLSPQALKDKARLATVLSKNKKTKEAAVLFAELADAAESDVVALNNAAMLYASELGDPRRAAVYAEKAYKLAPANPAIMDTLGWALLRKAETADLERALTLLRRASSGSDSPEIAFHYGVALRESGKKDEGEQLIRKALASLTEGTWRAEAEAALTN